MAKKTHLLSYAASFLFFWIENLFYSMFFGRLVGWLAKIYYNSHFFALFDLFVAGIKKRTKTTLDDDDNLVVRFFFNKTRNKSPAKINHVKISIEFFLFLFFFTSHNICLVDHDDGHYTFHYYRYRCCCYGYYDFW